LQPVYVAIATAGRKEILNETLQLLSEQVTPPDIVLVAPSGNEDYDKNIILSISLDIRIVESEKGSCKQRNAILDTLTHLPTGIVLFLDDDFFPEKNYIKELKKIFLENSDVVLATGHVLADGATGPGYSSVEALKLLEINNLDLANLKTQIVYNGYGCNMAVRLDTVNRFNIRFDEELPLYGWLEDVDFSRQLAPYGILIKSYRISGVHLGSKRGRSSGKRFGYSQVANPIYLNRKNTMSTKRALTQMLRNILANTSKILAPEPWVDRRGRVIGNFLAIKDLLLGRCNPGNIKHLS
jgi:GT2 family glycosyltransferase